MVRLQQAYPARSPSLAVCDARILQGNQRGKASLQTDRRGRSSAAAEDRIIKDVQAQAFGTEIKATAEKGRRSTHPAVSLQLAPALDEGRES